MVRNLAVDCRVLPGRNLSSVGYGWDASMWTRLLKRFADRRRRVDATGLSFYVGFPVAPRGRCLTLAGGFGDRV